MVKHLSSDNGTIGFDLKWAIAEVTRRTGVPRRVQLWEMFRLGRGPGQMDARGYYLLGLWRRDMPWERKLQFVSGDWGGELHKKLQPKELRTYQPLFNDKLLMAQVLDANGLAVPEVLATVGEPRLPAHRHFDRWEDLADFLKSVELPVFGKPVHSSRNLGSFSMLARDGNFAEMGNGSSVSIDELAGEIFRDHASGYVLQRFVTPHPGLAAFSARALPTLRVVTLRGPDGFKPLYVTLRLPGIKTNVDDMSSEGAAFALIDPKTGVLIKARDRDQMRGQDLTHHPASGALLSGFQVPHWDKVLAATETGHAIFPEHGNIGWDVAITKDGPILMEANYAPRHDALYQYPADAPFMAPEMKARIDWVLDDIKARIARQK